MRNYILSKLKQNKAFSLMEMLLVVAIIGVLTAISMPALGRLRAQLAGAEYDEYAKTIYLEAQNQLMDMRGDGSIQSLQNFGTQITAAPSDFDGTYDGTSLHYFLKDVAMGAGIISATTNTYQMPGQYVIECNRETGEVYGVFYWQNDDVTYPSPDFENDTDGYRINRTVRAAAKVGYYGGKNVNIAIAPEEPLNQVVELVNGEELYLKISYGADARILANPSALNIDCTIKGEKGGAWKTIDKLDMKQSLSATNVEFYYLLDSMEAGMDFATINNNMKDTSAIEVGDNLIVEVKAVFKDDKIYTADTDIVTGNSLFEEKASDNSEVKIASLRHFRNLSKYTNTADVVRILQTADIDFLNENYAWSNGSYAGVGSGTVLYDVNSSIAPISNESLFNRSSGVIENVKINVNGQGYHLQNFSISGSEFSGLFDFVENTSFENIRIEDIKVNGTDKVGALAGSIDGGSITNCGAYLTTYTVVDGEKQYYAKAEASNAVFLNEMEERYATYKISGNSNVGGLVGVATDVDVEKSFAAVRVDGSASVGGFAGKISNARVVNSYSSGDIYANSTAGGFAGTAESVNMQTSYTTSDLHVTSRAGGFLGNVNGGTYNNCYSYGEVLNKDDNAIPATAGGFLGEGSATFTECAFLKMEGYNPGINATSTANAQGIANNDFKGLTASSAEVIAMNGSYPYDIALLYNAFPFPQRTGTHYGNWPMEALNDSMLVYYERYADGTYGLYCETKLSAPPGAQSKDYVWVLDTLREEACVEDGYALLSCHDLSSFTYAQSVGSNGTYHSVDLAVDATAGDNKAVNLGVQNGLEFKGFDIEKAEYRGQTALATYTYGQMYLYQLPYKLQLANRENADNFYDSLIIYKGYARGGDGAGASPVVGGDQIATGLSFFYNPHFAKTAINPETQGSDQNKLPNPDTVFVRSARQLNRLGAHDYYWRTEAGTNKKIEFKQESDINFGTYTTTYCGQSYTMEIGSNDANKPIGRIIDKDIDNDEKLDLVSFANDYDGQGYRIIDYSLSSEEQFVGLFGRIQNANIKNVVMTASAWDKGKVISTYKGSEVNVVGSLVGLAYNYPEYGITNCATAGYLVEHDNANSSGSVVMGGLVGASLSNITNCAATNDVSLLIKDTPKSVYLGGLAGSHIQGNMQKGYAGGTIVLEDLIGRNLKDNGIINIAGICPGYHQTVSLKEPQSNATATYSNLYSYTAISVEAGDYDYIAGTVAGQVLSGIGIGDVQVQNCRYLDYVYEGYTVIDKNNDITEIDLRKQNAVGLPNKVTSAPNDADKGAEYTYPTSANFDKAYPYPTVITRPAYNEDRSIDENNSNHVHYGDWMENGGVYARMPAYFEQYGESPNATYGVYAISPSGVKENLLKNNTEGKKITRTAYGNLYYDRKNNDTDSIGIPVSLEGHTYYFYEESIKTNGSEHWYAQIGPNFKGDPDGKYTPGDVKGNGGKGKYPGLISVTKLHVKVGNDFAACISLTGENFGTETNPYQIRTWEQFKNLNGKSSTYAKQTYDIYAKDETAINIGANSHYDGGSEGNYSYVIYDAKSNVFGSNAGTIENCNVKESNIKVTADAVANNASADISGFIKTNSGTITNCKVINPAIGVTENNATFRMPNAVGFVVENKGTIDSSGVYATGIIDNAYIKGNKAYGFVGSNSGTITNSFVTAMVIGTANSNNEAVVAGFIGTNTGTIKNSYANAMVEARDNDGKAAGFVMNSTSSNDKMVNCYSVGSVSASDTDGFAYGFGESVNARDCYTLSKLSGKTKFGFAENGTLNDCYWIQDARWNYNEDVTTDASARTLWQMQSLEDYVSYTGEDYPYADSLETSSNYPYPSVGIPHYGDWPVVGYMYPYMMSESHEYAGIFYYEKYGDRYGIYAVGYDKDRYITKLIDTLADTMPTSGEKGYGIFYCDVDEKVSWEIKNSEGNFVPVNTYVSRSGVEEISDALRLSDMGLINEYKFYITDKNVENLSNYTHNIKQIVRGDLNTSTMEYDALYEIKVSDVDDGLTSTRKSVYSLSN